MLSRAHRLTSTLDYSRVVRHGARVSSPTLVLHLAQSGSPGPRIGFVVSKAVGNAPSRNRTKRRLRSLARELLGQLSGDVVVRALPAAQHASFDQLRGDLQSCLEKAVARG